jgi:hypothetical protein
LILHFGEINLPLPFYVQFVGFAAVEDVNLLGDRAVEFPVGFGDAVDDLVALDDSSEDDVVVVESVGNVDGDVELA